MLLLCIAVIPLINSKWWARNYSFISMPLGLTVVVVYYALFRNVVRIEHTGLEYFSFFIFIVSNIGGALTPIGAPPLFLGYLKGVPFFWVVANLWHFWIFAVLAAALASSFLDNAPTYLSFLSAAQGLVRSDVSGLVLQAPAFVIAISVASVFFGASTYIGNGPNFMVEGRRRSQGC